MKCSFRQEILTLRLLLLVRLVFLRKTWSLSGFLQPISSVKTSVRTENDGSYPWDAVNLEVLNVTDISHPQMSQHVETSACWNATYTAYLVLGETTGCAEMARHA